MVPSPLPEKLRHVRSLAFDLMGTCADWETSIVQSLSRLPKPPTSPPITNLELAQAWRSGFFRYIFESFERGEQSPDIDIVHRTVLDELLAERHVGRDSWGDKEREELVRSWHAQQAWQDAIEGIELLKGKYDVVVLANGTTRLQLDIVSSAGLPFHALFSSQLLGHTKVKPDPAIYRRCLELLDRKPEEVAMVAAHAYDLRAAKAVGMATVYVQRDTEDPEEDMAEVKNQVDLFVDGTRSTGLNGGILQLAQLLNSCERPSKLDER